MPGLSPTSYKKENPSSRHQRRRLSREVPCSALKGETVPDSLPATTKSSPTRRVPSRGNEPRGACFPSLKPLTQGWFSAPATLHQAPRVAPVNHPSPDKPRDLAEQPGRVKVCLEEVNSLLGALVAAWGYLRTYAATWGAWRACLASSLGCPLP